MTRNIVLSAEADRDLNDIWAFTAERWSIAQAESYLQGLDRLLKLLAEHPHIARERPDIGLGARLHLYRSHLILFSETPETLFVVRVIHSSADWQDWLSS